jgi:hypothetical protein
VHQDAPYDTAADVPSIFIRKNNLYLLIREENRSNREFHNALDALRRHRARKRRMPELGWPLPNGRGSDGFSEPRA